MQNKSQQLEEKSQEPQENSPQELPHCGTRKERQRAHQSHQTKDGQRREHQDVNQYQYVAKDPHSSQVLRVQRLEHGVVCEYVSKEEIERVVQENMKSD